MNRDDVKDILSAVRHLWPHSRIVPEGAPAADVLDLWERMMDGIDPRAAMAALEVLAGEGREHAPPVGVIRRQAALLAADASGDGAPDVGAAWAEIGAQIGRHGRYGDPVWSHPVVATAVASIGYVALCNQTNPDVAFAHFRRTYEPLLARHERSVVLPERLRQTLGEIGARFAPHEIGDGT